MSDWNPDLYRQFEDERTRPAVDLLARVGPGERRHVVDLGCGSGNSTQLLVERFPAAEVLGIDNSGAMIASARKRLPAITFERGDIANWQPDTPPDLVFANAALQWVGDHGTLIPRLFDSLAPGGTLAIQMPDNRDEPTHRLMRELAALSPWREIIETAAASHTHILSLPAYYDLLGAEAVRVDVWRTAYQHPMADAAGIVEWVRATGLRPFVDPLPDDLKASFLSTFEQRIAEAYPPRADGRLLFAFPRLFIVAHRAGA